MPYIEKPEEDEDGLQVGATPGALAPAPAGARQADTAAPAASQNAGKTPGRFVNFARYFNANKAGATATGNQLAGGIEKRGADAQGQLQTRVGQFGEEVKRGMGAAGVTATAPVSAPPQPTSAVAPRTQPASGGKAPPAIATTTPNSGPTPPPAPRETVEWKGPGSLSEGAGWNELVAGAGKAADEAKQTATSAGTQALLQERMKSGTYTPGQSRFDAGLVGAASGDKFAALRERFGGLPKALSDAETASAAASKAAQGTVGAYNEKVSAENAQLAAARKAQLDAEAEYSKPKPPSAPDEVRRKQRDEDLKTNQWMGDILRKNRGGFLGIGGTSLESMLPAKWWELPADKANALVGDGSPFMQAVIRELGPDAAREFANAFRDMAGRRERISQYKADAEGARAETHRAAVEKNSKNPNYRPQYQGESDWLEPYINWLYDEQVKRNNGQWAPDTVI